MCVGERDYKFRPDAELTAPVEECIPGCSPGKRRMYRCYVPSVEGVWAPAVHSNCLHNEWAALALRTMGETPSDPLAWDINTVRVFRGLRVKVARMGMKPWSLGRVAASYKGRLGQRYVEALESLEGEGAEMLGHRDYKLSAFLKGEKFNPTAKVSKPRMICPRSSRYNLVLSSYLKPLEHALWKRWKCGNLCAPTRVSGKGLNGVARAALIDRKMRSIGDAAVFEVDGKAFEAHVSSKQLRLEHGVYKAAYPGDRQLRDLLEVQLKLKGKTSGGIRFQREGCRASGDTNTGMGNTVLMGGFTISALQQIAPDSRWTILADGDNALLFVERLLVERVRAAFGPVISQICGHEMTVERPVHTLEEVVFGQSQPCFAAGRYTMVRNPWKVLSGAFCGYRHFHEPRFAKDLISGIAMAERSWTRGLPVLGPYFSRVCELGRSWRTSRNLDDFLEGHLINLPPDPGETPISLESRVSFEMAFGVDPPGQLLLERLLIEGLDGEFVDVVESARWLTTVSEVAHGKPQAGGDNTKLELFWEGLSC